MAAVQHRVPERIAALRDLDRAARDAAVLWQGTPSESHLWGIASGVRRRLATLLPAPFAIRRARIKRGLTIKAMAAEIGVTASLLSRVERGQHVRPANMLRIADYFGVRASDIWPEV